MPRDRRLRVLIAGGGVAAAEAALALTAHAGGRTQVELLSDHDAHAPVRVALTRLEALGVRLRGGRLASVDPDRRRAVTVAGDELPYDRLIVATGAVRRPAVPGALTLWPEDDGSALVSVPRLAVVLPEGPAWQLPFYEFALLSARRPATTVTVVTPEARPLDLFGDVAAAAVARVLERAGVELRTRTTARAVTAAGLLLADGETLAADAVAAAPALTGPRLPGLPADPGGFVIVDEHYGVPGCPGVFAAGDVTAGPVKQACVAAQQADIVAAAIAAWAGAAAAPASYRPVLRGLLLTGGEPLYLRADGRSVASHQALWWPPVKFAGRHLASFLVSGGRSHEPLVDREPA